MKPGDKVRHKLSGEDMTVLRVNDTVATCKITGTAAWSFRNQKYEERTAVCQVENLELIEEKQT